MEQVFIDNYFSMKDPHLIGWELSPESWTGPVTQ